MKYFTVIAMVFVVFFHTGCEQLEPTPPKKVKKVKKQIIQKKKTPKEIKKLKDLEKKSEIVILKQRVKELNTKDKQLIYRAIQNDIDSYSKEGDYTYAAGYHSDALTAYRLVNFYEGYDAISQKKITKIYKIASLNSEKNYKIAMGYVKKRYNKSALKAFNRVSMNKKNYKDTAIHLHRLKQPKKMKVFIKSLQLDLSKRLRKNTNSIKSLKKLSTSFKALEAYNYKDELVTKAAKSLRINYRRLINSAISSYKKGHYKTAKTKLLEINSIYTSDWTTKKYLKRIKSRQNKSQNLQTAQKNLKDKKYKVAIEYAQIVISVDSTNKKAKRIIVVAKEEQVKLVENYVSVGVEHYNSKNIDEARKNFRKALAINPRDRTSLIYSKKIDRQLKTINSLK